MIVVVAWLCAGLTSAWWQLAKAPPAIDSGVGVDLTGVVTRVDGRMDERLRV